MSGSHTVLLVGGPDAGKTNFLSRLWLALRDRTGRLYADGLPADLSYLEETVEFLLRGEFAPRTQSEAHNHVLIPIADSQGVNSLRGTLLIPDCSGEQWKKIYQNREWTDIWEDIIPDVRGCLIFIRADSGQNIMALDWTFCEHQFGSTSNIPGSTILGQREYEVPTQLVLVDWLQCLRSAFTARISGAFRPRIGVVVSAWDLVPADQQEHPPLDYVGSIFPLFRNFIESNGERFEFQSFGVSIVGGDLRSAPDFRDEYLNGDPHAVLFSIIC